MALLPLWNAFTESFINPAAKKTAWQATLAAAKPNLFPGLALQVFALTIVLAYYFNASIHELLEQLAQVKNHYGAWYSLFATAFFGGFIPWIYLRLNPNTRRQTPWQHFVFLILFWAWKGIEVEYFYRLQNFIFGSAPTLKTIVSKVIVDQFFYTPLYSAPGTLILFYWKEKGFGGKVLWDLNFGKFLRNQLPTALLATWIVWIPAVAIIYSLPASLQIPLFNIVLCFFSLLYVTLTRKNQN